MLTVKVLGAGCANCDATVALIADVARVRGLAVHVEQTGDMPTIVSYGVLRTPAVVIDERVVYSGSVPPRDVVETWL